MTNLTFILLLIFFIGISCNNNPTQSKVKYKLQSLLKIKLSDSIEITDYETGGGIQGDFTEAFVVHFRKEEFLKIFRQVRPERLKFIGNNIYGYTISENNKMKSAIFDYNQWTIKYTCSY